jgi:hypothetical protein
LKGKTALRAGYIESSIAAENKGMAARDVRTASDDDPKRDSRDSSDERARAAYTVAHVAMGCLERGDREGARRCLATALQLLDDEDS